MRKYTIITQSELANMNFSLLLTTSEDTARHNLDSSEFIVSFKGNTPTFLEGKTIYTNTELFEMVDDINNNWITEEE
tara:strand:+ start:1490 stop:1720 length:231 start_codon:yes stop_codon:yes gene_type:complete